MPTNYVYCDESHVDTHAYRVQGGVWVPEIGMRAVRDAFKALRAKHPKIREFKWEYVTGAEPMKCYRDLMDLFLTSDVAPMLTFNCLVVRRSDDVSQLADKSGKDLGFFKAYYTLLYYRLWHGSDNHITIDERSSPRDAPTDELRQCLNNAAQRLERPFRVISCKMEKSKHDDLLQLADVLAGAVGWAWNGMRSTCGAKPTLHNQIVDVLGWRTLRGRFTRADAPKFNVWLYQPKTK